MTGAGSCKDLSSACLLVGGSFSCCETLATARDRFEPELFRFLWGELVAFGMLMRGCLRVVVAMLPNVSCGEGGMNTAAAIHMAVDMLLWSLRPREDEILRGAPTSKY